MELFYNPERMSETEIKETFVAYQWLVDEIISILKRQPKGAGVQHVVIVAPRGMGKTTLLLMLRFTVLSQDISKRWQPVLFPEESYSIYDLADLWVEVMDHVASETGDVALHDQATELKGSHPDSYDLEAVALASIKDWREKNKKRLLLLIDNFDMILDQIGDEKDNASLRDVLMNDGTMMLVGGSTTFFKEARAYDQPLYNLFKIYNLDGLDSEQTEELLRRRAKMDGLENFDEILRTNRSRLRVLQYFTGGNPRLALMLYRILAHSDISEVHHGLEKLLDEVTPYYKAKIETLPPQQRKILDQIARISAQTREGLTPTEIASATRLPVNQTSSQLRRLADFGYVRAANIRGRSSYYTLSEPLYAIWHQMRFDRNSRKRMNWLIAFLKGWYDAKELRRECQRLQSVFKNHLTAGREKDARDVLEHRRYLMETIDDQKTRISIFESVVLSYLELRDVNTLKNEILTGIDFHLLSSDTCQRLLAAGLMPEHGTKPHPTTASAETADHIKAAINEQKYIEAAELLERLENQLPKNSVRRSMAAALKNLFSNKPDECLANIEIVLEKMPDLTALWTIKGFALKQASKLSEAVDAFSHAVEVDLDSENLTLLAETYEEMGRSEEALEKFEKALELEPNDVRALCGRARSLAKLDRKEEALVTYDLAISVSADSFDVWYERGKLLAEKEEREEALKSFDRASELNQNVYDLSLICWELYQLHQRDKALDYAQRILELEPSSADGYFLRGMLGATTDIEASMSDLNHAFSLTSSSHRFFIDTLGAKVLKMKLSIITNDFDKAAKNWKELIEYSQNLEDSSVWQQEVSGVVTFVAESGHWTFAKELIRSGNLEQSLFPLARALDYLISGDEAIIEKLSPEIRRIVREIVTAFERASSGKRTKVKSKKEKTRR